MSRPTTLQHPVARLRTLTGLGRQQFAAHIRLAQSTLEKIERRERVLTPPVAHRIFEFTGVCPSCLSDTARPLHTADGHPYTDTEFTRWRSWQDLPAIPAPLPSGTGFAGRPLGPHHDEACCPPVLALTSYGPMTTPDVGAHAVRAAQNGFRRQIPRLLAQQLIDLARGVAAECLKDRHMGETRLLEALHDLRTRCPSARPIPSPEEEEAARTAFRRSGDDRSPRPHPPRRRQS